MTNPALTAAVTAAREFADAMEKAHAAINAPECPTEAKVGYTATTEAAALALLGRLPEGAEVTDRDGDSWTTTADGGVQFQQEDYRQDARSAAAYCPLTVSYLPEPEPEQPESVFKRGDRVIIRDVEFSNRRRYIGQEATVADTPFGASTLHGVITADGAYVAATRVEKVSDDPTPDPTTTRVEIRTTADRDRVVAAEPGIYGEGSVFISVKDHDSRSAAWLSRDEARQLAATLTKIADAP